MFILSALKYLSDNSNISIISVSASINCLFFSLRSSWFWVWNWRSWNLNIFIWWSEILDLVYSVLAVFLWHCSGGGGEVRQVGIEVQVPYLGYVNTWRRKWQRGSSLLRSSSHWWEFPSWLTCKNGLKQTHLSLVPDLFLSEFGNLRNKVHSDSPHI